MSAQLHVTYSLFEAVGGCGDPLGINQCAAAHVTTTIH